MEIFRKSNRCYKLHCILLYSLLWSNQHLGAYCTRLHLFWFAGNHIYRLSSFDSLKCTKSGQSLIKSTTVNYSSDSVPNLHTLLVLSKDLESLMLCPRLSVYIKLKAIQTLVVRFVCTTETCCGPGMPWRPIGYC